MDVTEKVQESETAGRADSRRVIEMAVPIAVEREELPLLEERSKTRLSRRKSGRYEAETVECHCRGRRRGRNAAKFTDEELEAQALAAQAAEEAGDGCSAGGRRRAGGSDRSGAVKTD